MSMVQEGPAKELLASQLQKLKAQQAQQKPPTLGSKLNSAESRVKKATQKKQKLEVQLRDTQELLLKETEFELQKATQTLEEVKAQLKGEHADSSLAVKRQPSQELAVADIATGVCKELAQILTTLQLRMPQPTSNPAPISPKNRSRSSSRSKPKRGKGS
eukprot:158497-Amphidinium_carterae.1